MRTPIFDQLRDDQPAAPICPICGRPDLTIPDGEPAVCTQCFMRNRHLPEAHREWHCHVCGEFLDGLNRIVMQVNPHEVIFVCPEHFQPLPEPRGFIDYKASQ